MSHCLASSRNFFIGRISFLVAWMMVPYGMLTLFFDGSPVGMAPSWGYMKELVAPESNTAWCFMHHTWSDCFSSPISSHCWFARLTPSFGLRLLNKFSSAHCRPSASFLTGAVHLSCTWRCLIWLLLIIWSHHLTFFFDKILLISGGFWTGDLRLFEFWSLSVFELKHSANTKMCEFWSSTGFGLEFLVDSRIFTFLSLTGVELEPLFDSQICTFLSSTELGLRMESDIFDVWGQRRGVQ